MKCKHKGGSPCHLIDWFEKNPDKCPECVIEEQAEQITELKKIEGLIHEQAEMIAWYKNWNDKLSTEVLRLEAENQRLEELIFRMSIIHPDGYPKPMEKMIADIYNKKQQRIDDEQEDED